MKVNIAWSTNDDSSDAGNTIAKKAVLDLVQTKLAIIFSSEKYNTINLLKGAKSILGTAPIIGCTSQKGIITPDGLITSKKGFAGIMAMGDNDTAVGTAILDKGTSARETGKAVARIARNKINPNCSPSYFMMISTPGDEEEYLKGIQDEIGDVPCFGGVASDDDLSGNWKIYTEEGISSNGVCVAFFYTNKEIKNVLDGRYHETIHSGVITKKTGDYEIDEINGMQALKVYSEWINKKTKDLKGEKITKETTLYPIGVKSHDGELYIINEILNGNTDYSINVSNKISTNIAVVQMQTSDNEIAESSSMVVRELNEIATRTPVAYLLFNSANRINEINKNSDEEYAEILIEKLKKETNNKPFIMAMSMGEIGRKNHSSNLCGNLMISATVFAE